jgi:hypothetical protein
MARRSLFLALTGMLVVVLGYLVVQGRKEEKKRQQQVARPVEIIRESKASLTRILTPPDLEIVESRMQLSGAAETLSARNEVVIRNKGTVTYRNPRVRLTFLGHRDKVLQTQTKELNEILQPGQVRAMAEILSPGVPVGTVKSAAVILSAEVEGAATPGK